jgi:nitroimidazol reductase NimA-like FMN-containing flavoprotein (pyridoxamine 5'-phosphate oxidase superfamily)
MAHKEECYEVDPEFRVKRVAERANYVKNDVNAIIDNAYLCHISFIHNNRPTAIPLACWRDADYIYFHAANKGRLGKNLIKQDVCISIAQFDGLVLGHSAFNHSYNYRSVIVHGVVEEVCDFEKKMRAMKAFMERVLPGRWQDIRAVQNKEIQAITVMRVKLDQAVGKIRDEFPDEETDTPDWPTWIGVIPAKIQFGVPDPDPTRNTITKLPSYIDGYKGIDEYRSQYRCKFDK